ncbi:MAG: tRNA (adenosine(37)-N6)-threonylcarbamoyltransferase complex ATPase subunit type 1 TsaE [Phycisphaerales bacterium]|nr:MAG: tRNA (adenosine(37)-N6)-threonylcarbamoyltransferase complex ATPase subunit type 1 TsaE [Phycisphaerales bacterium]
MNSQIITESPEETMALARALACHLRGGDFLALSGPLGSGKTCFVRGLAAGLGIPGNAVSSPTFIICQEYEPPNRTEGGGGDGGGVAAAEQESAGRVGGVALVHMDVYRLTDPSELETIGWEERLDSPGAVIAVEWADRIASALPESRIDVTFAHVDENRRAITIAASRGLEDRLKSLPARGRTDSPGRCPICGTPVGPADKRFPFCSERCRYVDLGRWFDEDYTATRPIGEGDLE